MKVLSLLLRNLIGVLSFLLTCISLNESPELIAQESIFEILPLLALWRLNESPELIAQECWL